MGFVQARYIILLEQAQEFYEHMWVWRGYKLGWFLRDLNFREKNLPEKNVQVWEGENKPIKLLTIFTCIDLLTSQS